MITKQEYNRYKLFWSPSNKIISVYDYQNSEYVHHIKIEWLDHWNGKGCSLPYMAHIMEFLVNFHPN